MTYSTDEMKNKLKDMFSWFHSFCTENGLRYYMLGGTMLGAVRHGGFIPWDDDIDVGMPREDYEKLEKLLSGKRVGKYVLETPNTEAEDYFYAFSKLYDTTTTLIENTRFKIKRGLYIDIFPLDGIGNTRQEAEKNYSHVHKTYNLLLTRVAGIRKGRKWYKNLAVTIARAVPNFILNNKKILQKLIKICKKYSFDESTYGGNLVGAWRFREVMPTSIMGKPTIYNFEGLEVYGAEDFDGYLTSLYGDWRKLPPEEKRVTHHDYILCDLDKPYIE